jgi:hypothetical protein
MGRMSKSITDDLQYALSKCGVIGLFVERFVAGDTGVTPGTPGLAEDSQTVADQRSTTLVANVEEHLRSQVQEKQTEIR